MSVYGLARLLGSRDVGPAQLAPPLEAFRASARQHHELLDALFAKLREGAGQDDQLVQAVTLVESEARRVCGEIDVAFDQPAKLKARQRLELERAAQRLGGELEAVRWLAAVTAAATSPRAALVSPGELLGDQWRTGPTFVAEQIKVVVPAGMPAKLHGDPLVLRALLELHLRALCAAGHDQPALSVEPDGAEVSLLVGQRDTGLKTTSEHMTLSLGVALEAEATVLAAAAAHLGIGVVADPGRGLVTLSLQAA